MLVRSTNLTLLLVVAMAIPACSAFAQPPTRSDPKDWSEHFPPHHMIGNIYYVGSRGLAAYLITTPQGHILINSNLKTSVPLLRESIEKLGFHFADIKILLISHAHFDHDGSSAEIKKLTGAKYMVMDADVPVVESGGESDFQYGDDPALRYPATKVDRVLHDGDEVRLGDTVLVAHLTAGHTRGCTTWSMKVQNAGKIYSVVIVGSPNVNPGYKLVNNARYPEIARDYERGFQVLKSLPRRIEETESGLVCAATTSTNGPIENPAQACGCGNFLRTNTAQPRVFWLRAWRLFLPARLPD